MDLMPKFEGVEVVGFDLDNALYVQSAEVDQEIQAYIYREVALLLDIDIEVAQSEFDRRYRGGQGMSGGQALRDMGIDTSSRDFVQEALEFADVTRVLQPDPYVHWLLQELGYRHRSVDLLTGSFAEQAFRKLGALGLETGLFGKIITGEDHVKSTGEAYRYWMSQYPDLKPGQFLYAGDRYRVDCETPAQLGIQVALVNAVEINPDLPVQQFRAIQDFGKAVLTLTA